MTSAPDNPNRRPSVALMSLLDRIGDATVARYDRDRREHPHRHVAAADGVGPDFMFAANVATMLGCGLDHVRRIPRSELPASRVGQRLVYSRQDVLRYIEAKRDVGSSRFIPDRAQRQPSAQPEERTSDRASAAASTFDPVAHARSLVAKAPQPHGKAKK